MLNGLTKIQTGYTITGSVVGFDSNIQSILNEPILDAIWEEKLKEYFREE